MVSAALTSARFHAEKQLRRKEEITTSVGDRTAPDVASRTFHNNTHRHKKGLKPQKAYLICQRPFYTVFFFFYTAFTVYNLFSTCHVFAIYILNVL